MSVPPNSAKLAIALDGLRGCIASSNMTPENENYRHYNNVKIIIRLQVQPWHASSIFTHEAALAVRINLFVRSLFYVRELSAFFRLKVARVSPESFWPFSLLVSDSTPIIIDFLF
jgi:hypothetical protein